MEVCALIGLLIVDTFGSPAGRESQVYICVSALGVSDLLLHIARFVSSCISFASDHYFFPSISKWHSRCTRLFLDFPPTLILFPAVVFFPDAGVAGLFPAAAFGRPAAAFFVALGGITTEFLGACS